MAINSQSSDLLENSAFLASNNKCFEKRSSTVAGSEAFAFKMNDKRLNTVHFVAQLFGTHPEGQALSRAFYLDNKLNELRLPQE